MTNDFLAGNTYLELATGSVWAVVTNENGGSGLEILVFDSAGTPSEDDKGHKLGQGEGVTLNLAGNTLYGRSTKLNKPAEAVVTTWSTVV